MKLQLNAAQRDAVEAADNILCCACPGSGKTRVLTAKVRHVLAVHPDPRIVMTTFSRDAANEMVKRIKEDKHNPISEQALSRLNIGTFHSLALRQLREVKQVGKLLSEIQTRHLIHRSLHDTRMELSLEDADAFIARCKSDQRFAEENPDYAKLTACYRKHQEEMGALDFTDLLIMANAMMADGRLKPIKATHLFSDETQDIDRMQYDWLMHHCVQNPVLCAVGDDDQSIYGFRRSLGYRGMMDMAAATGARIVQLDTNYRSTGGIVDAASRLISGNIDRVPKTITAHRGAGPAPRLINLEKDDCQASRIIQMLDKICANNPAPRGFTMPASGMPYRFFGKAEQVAVLARTNSQLHVIERVFQEQKVPYLRMGRSFWDIPALQVYLAILQSVVNRDGLGMEIALRWARVTENHLRELRDAAGGNFWNYITDQNPVALPAVISKNIAELLECARGWVRKSTDINTESAASGAIDGVAVWMIQVIENKHPDDDGKKKRTRGTSDIKQIEFIRAANDSLIQRTGSLSERLHAALRQDNKEIPRVILSTHHASKGLEWDHVFLIDVYQGSVPKIEDNCLEEALAEERRVFYVAMTRARDHLTILGRMDKQGSEFIDEIGLGATPAELEIEAQQQEEFALT